MMGGGLVCCCIRRQLVPHCSANNPETHVAQTLSITLVDQLHHVTMFQSHHVLFQQQPKTSFIEFNNIISIIDSDFRLKETRT